MSKESSSPTRKKDPLFYKLALSPKEAEINYSTVSCSLERQLFLKELTLPYIVLTDDRKLNPNEMPVTKR